MNKINQLFQRKNSGLLSIYFTAGYPSLNDTNQIIESLTTAGADMIEIGIPFSDPMADGPVIQYSSERAISNDMTLSILFDQLSARNNKTEAPLILMGYLNPILQYGIARFLDDCVANGISGVIIPDLPPEIFKEQYQSLFEAKEIKMIFLITPQTPASRIREIDDLTDAFIYMVTAPGTTGKNRVFEARDHEYFETVKNLQLRNPLLAGFGIHDSRGFTEVCRYVHGAIVGSSFIRALSLEQKIDTSSIQQFIQNIRP